MRGELVALDLETTGLDPRSDSIIEIGAVRLRDGEIIDSYSQLIDPGFPIPPGVTHITGIRTDDVIGQPRIASVLPALRRFVRDSPLVGHNIGFDAAFLARQGVFEANARIDTYEMASVLLPRAPRYNLHSLLTEEMKGDMDDAHRALSDAKAAARLYWGLWLKALDLPYRTLREIVEAAQGLNWSATPVFAAALNEKNVRGEHDPGDDEDIVESLFEPLTDEGRPLRPGDTVQHLDEDAVLHLIDDGGALDRAIPGYERRSQQMDMMRAVVQAFNSAQQVMIEAGTGTGKSIAYLIPAILWSALNEERVVISTHAINLQEQLIYKDLPALASALDIPFRVALLKGRSNYLCPRRLAAVRRRRPTSVEELRTLAKILVWLLESSTGDKGEISLRGPVENITWQRLSAEDEGCMLDRCRAVMEGACPFYKARRRAEAAHLLIVNHALLLSDATTDNRVLPEYRHLIIDEAHHLEDAVTDGLSFRLDEAVLRRRLADLGGPNRGLLGALLASADEHAPEKEVSKLRRYISTISEATSVMELHIGSLFGAVRTFLDDVIHPRGGSD